jgi:RNA polymerase sigma-70 factor (ECF subfamily)
LVFSSGHTDLPGTRVPPGNFRTTHWTVVLQAQRGESVEALEALCRNYWQPLYAYARRHGHPQHDAEDLTQSFFARMLEKDYLKVVQREKGPFRAFLLMAFKRFIANSRSSQKRIKRGGGQDPISLDSQMAERLYREDDGSHISGEELYDRRWALAFLEQTIGRLRQEFDAAGKAVEFETLKPCLAAARGNIVYADVAARLATTEAAARVAVHRLRKRFRQLFREQIAQTVVNEAQLDDELRHLLSALSREN